MKRLVWLALAGGSLFAACPARAGDCAARGGLEFICGTVASEDVVPVPGSRFLLVSGLGLGQPGRMFLVDRRHRHVRPLAIAGAARGRGDCATPPLPEESSFAGLSLRRDRGGALRVAVVNDGRRAIETFRLDPRLARLHWQGCAKMPAGSRPNAVALLADGALLATSFYDPTDPQAWHKMARGEPSGAVLEWKRDGGAGFVPVRGLDAISGPNGIEASADGAWLYVSAWATRELLVVHRASGRTRRIALGFLPDNIHRQPDGSLIVAGQRTQVDAIAACRRECPQPWTVVRIDPRSGAISTLLEGPGDPLVNYATGATLVGGTLYVAARGDNRIVVAPIRRASRRTD